MLKDKDRASVDQIVDPIDFRSRGWNSQPPVRSRRVELGYSRMADWFRGKQILIVEDNYIVASHLETELLHHNAVPVGPAGSVGDALNLMFSTLIDAAILDVELMTESSLPVADVLIRRGTPFVFLSKPPTNWIPTRYRALVLNKPPELSVVSQLFARLSKTHQDNVIPFDAYRSREAGGDLPQSD